MARVVTALRIAPSVYWAMRMDERDAIVTELNSQNDT